jgi:hypothetical protein
MLGLQTSSKHQYVKALGTLFAAVVLTTLMASGRKHAPSGMASPRMEETPFTHAKHVPEAWSRGEQERSRDCRGCHRYDAADPHDPQTVCSRCHFTNEINDYQFDLSKSEPGFESDLSALRTPGGLFRHSVHLALECRTCHPTKAGAIETPALLPTLTGFSLCTGCHGGEPTRDLKTLPFMSNVTEAERNASRQRLKANLVDVLNNSPTMGPNQGDVTYVGPFRHADHIPAAQLRDAQPLKSAATASSDPASLANCATCHQPMFASGAAATKSDGQEPFETFQQSIFQQSPSLCGTCHIADAGRTPIVFTVESTPRASSSAGTFSHQAHLAAAATQPATGAVANADAHTTIQEQGCATCHEFDGLREQTYAVRQERAGFQGCQTCHDVAPWTPAEHDGWWLPRDHGDWQACNGCHVFGEPDFKTTRPMAEVRRRKPGTFRIEKQAHPMITSKSGDAIQQDCATCHRAVVPELPSRLRDTAFQHATHLPLEPKPGDCAECHASRINSTSKASEIGFVTRGANNTNIDLVANLSNGALAKPLVGLVYEPAACVRCHLGSAPVASRPFEGLENEPARQVVEFSHQGHLGKAWHAGPAMSCLDCHAIDRANAAALMTTKPDALNCTQCHDHSKRATTTSGVSTAEVQGCATCHISGTPALPVPGQQPVATVLGAHIANIEGGARQFHPNDQDCKTCHVTMMAPQTRPPSSNRVVATRTFYTPSGEQGRKTAIHRGNTSKLPEDRTDCFLCHWTDAYMDAPGERGGTTNPESTLIRRLRGDDMRDFPGGK